MQILSFKPGHDGTIALVTNGELVFSIEAEKDSYPRYSDPHIELFFKSMSYTNQIPDVIALSGWRKKFNNHMFQPLGGGYFDTSSKPISYNINFFGQTVQFFSSSHVRSHIIGTYGLSSLEQGEECYCLVWEGLVGSFYEIDGQMNITHLGEVLESPGNKYAFAYSLADHNVKSTLDQLRPAEAGKLMALTSFSHRKPYTPEEKEIVDTILKNKYTSPLDKNKFKQYNLHNVGVESDEFKNFSGNYSDTIFDLFYDFAKKNLRKKLPLLICGGCGLNCDWNTKWKDSGLFQYVFVPPIANDSGSAIGTAIDAQLFYTGKVKINWNVYAGEEFTNDEISLDGIEVNELNYTHLADYLSKDKVVAWVQGKYEIGPRALGNRSILASPLSNTIQARLNSIKLRENFRPIAPICIEEDISKHFVWNEPSPHMLYFQKVKTNKLPGITHVDGTARVQTVNSIQNKKIYKLLIEFRNITGFGVLCNTSLNFSGMGFINKRSDLLEYSRNHKLDGFVIYDKFYKFKF